MKMKNLSILLMMILGVSCKTAQVSIQVMKPAQITLPADVKTIAVVNRSLPAKKDRLRNVVEGVITGEGLFVDRMGSEECIKGVVNGLANSPRLKGLIPGNIDLRGTGTRQFAEPLDWATVKKICDSNGTDALACLEVFDSDCSTRVNEQKRTKKEKDKEITYFEYTAHLNVNIESGWRIYFPANQQILDQNIFNDSRYWDYTSDTPKKAEQGLISKDNAVSQAGNYAGNQFAMRISPLWIWVNRIYYVKGNNDFAQAKRRVQANDWKGASDLWMKYTQNSDPKVAGNACYNMALASEIEGDLQGAIDWAKKAYVDYKNSKALNYMNIIQHRLDDQARLDEQMKGVQ